MSIAVKKKISKRKVYYYGYESYCDLEEEVVTFTFYFNHLQFDSYLQDVSFEEKMIPGDELKIIKHKLYPTFSCHFLIGRLKCCQILLKHGADASLKIRQQGWTVAHCAAEIGNLGILKLLYDYSSPMTICDHFEAKPKDIARIYGHKTCVEFLEK